MKGPMASVLIVLLGLSHPLPASAQSILVQVTEAETRAPVQGAFVSLLDAEDQVVRSALTNPTGRFLFVVASPGQYRVRVEMIGRESRLSDPVVLGADQSLSLTVALPARAVALAGIEVKADEQCHLRPDEATALGQVWEAARRALSVQAWAEREGTYRLDLTTWERHLDAGGRVVEGETRRGLIGVTRTPFVSLPPEDLVEGGFIRPLEEGGHQYYGPDARVLLSDLFLGTHCFRLTRSGGHPGSIGLAFEPARGTESSDIEGTLWLEEETAKLRFLEFGYTRVPYGEGRTVASGRVEFGELPDGAWVINRWWIRAPILARHPNLTRAGDSGIRVSGILETGGEVTRVRTLTDERVSQVVGATISGVVWDSTRAAPLGGATVHLSGTPYSAVTDGEGRFELADLPEGVYSAAFHHPRLDSLGLVLPAVEVEAERGGRADLQLAVPSEASIQVAACREEGQREGTTMLTGTVMDRASRAPIPAAKVMVEWLEVQSVEPMLARDQWLEVGTNERGTYVACGIPTERLIKVRTSFLEWESEELVQELPAGQMAVLDVTMDLPPGLLSQGARTAGAGGAYGDQGVQGVLVDPGSGKPVRSAEVTVRDPSGAVTGSAVTDSRGFFRILTPVPGRYVFSVRALGYAELAGQAVEVPYGRLAVVEVQMAPAALELEPLVVTVEPRAFHLEMEGFYDRKTKGLDHGIFFTPEDLEERRPRKLSDIFFGIPGVRVAEPSLGAGGRALWFQTGERLNDVVCFPMVYVDHHLASNGGYIDNGPDPTAADTYVHGLDVAAVEIYRGASEVPPEFNGANAGCGVIVIWTGRGRGR